MILQGKNYSEITFIERENILGSRNKFICSSCLLDPVGPENTKKNRFLVVRGPGILCWISIYLLCQARDLWSRARPSLHFFAFPSFRFLVGTLQLGTQAPLGAQVSPDPGKHMFSCSPTGWPSVPLWLALNPPVCFFHSCECYWPVLQDYLNVLQTERLILNLKIKCSLNPNWLPSLLSSHPP